MSDWQNPNGAPRKKEGVKKSDRDGGEEWKTQRRNWKHTDEGRDIKNTPIEYNQ